MDLKLRKFAKFVDKTFIEGGKKAKEPVLLVSVAAVIENPWAGKGFVEDLKPEILDLAPQLGDLLVTELTKEIGSGDKILDATVEKLSLKRVASTLEIANVALSSEFT